MGMGGLMAGSFMSTIAGVVIGTAVADAIFSDGDGGGDAGDGGSGGDQGADAGDTGSDGADGGYDSGGYDAGGGDFGSGDFGGGGLRGRLLTRATSVHPSDASVDRHPGARASSRPSDPPSREEQQR
jgi:hypothetical protein